MPRYRLVLLLALLIVSAIGAFAAPEPPKQIVAYVFPNNSAIQPGQIDPHSITRINYAFALIKDGRIVPDNPHDAQNLALVTALRKQNPSLTILISVGGWLGSGGFSDVSLTRQSRARFIDSVMDFLAQHDLDGLDVDWEYPAQPGAGNKYRAADKKNYTLLLSELRRRFDAAQKKTGRRLYLTVAAGASDDFLDHTRMRQVAKVVDNVNLMAYDYYEPDSGPIAGHHAALYTNPADPGKDSADASVNAFEAAGVPAEKLVLGIPFYGHSWSGVPDRDHGLYQPGKPGANRYGTFDFIQSSLLGHGYTRYWDEVSQVPWLYNSETRTFVSYEDEQSVAGKCRYVLAHKLAGVMFWDLEADSAGKLLGAIDNSLR
ncbi:MAG: glycoside hydrolase family 18 protein [Terracidiphilus sp.]